MTSQLYGKMKCSFGYFFFFYVGTRRRGKKSWSSLQRETDEILTYMVDSSSAMKLSGRKTGDVQSSKTYLYLSVQEFCVCM